MRRFALLAAGTLFGAAAAGQSLVDCIDPDVLRGLMLRGGNPVTFRAAAPPELATFKAPAAFTWIGSAERLFPEPPLAGQGARPIERQSVTASWRTSLPPATASVAAGGALAAAGWKLAPRDPALDFTRPHPFTAGEATPLPATYCLDGDAATVNTGTIDGANYVMLNVSRGMPGVRDSNLGCNAPPPSPSQFFPSLSLLRFPLAQHLPKLDAPTDPTNGRPAILRLASTSVSDRPFESIVRFTLRDSPANVARHFAQQLAQQGWTADASWSAATTAGSTWTKDAAANTLLHATLSVAVLEGNEFSASLRVSQAR